MIDGSKSKGTNYGPHFWKTTYFNIALLVAQCGNATQNLMTDVIKSQGYGNIGFNLFATMYLFQVIAAMNGAAFVQRVGIKMAMICGCLFVSVSIFAQIIPTQFEAAKLKDNEWQKTLIIMALYLGNMIAGAGQALLGIV